MKKLQLAPDLTLPTDAVTQTFAFVAQKGYGKTYAAGKLAEELHAAGAPVVVLDPVGTWWGLRLSTDGRSEGLPIPVFGGEHGDLPLTPDSGKIVAWAILDKYVSAVLDVSSFRKAERERFVASFAEELFQRAKRIRVPLMLVLEEAQKFCPQQSRGSERIVGAIEDIVRLGRNYGIGAAMLTQRPQSVNKEVLNQVEALFVGKLNAAHERKAVEAWIVEKGIDETTKGLTKLSPGEFYFWSPSWLETFRKVHISKKRTFDTSRTPKLGERRRQVRTLAPVDIDALKGALKDTITKAEQDDPKLLRRKIAELQHELTKRVPKPPIVKVKELSDRQIKRLERVRDELGAEVQAVTASVTKQVQALELLNRGVEASVQQLSAAILEAARPVPPSPVLPARSTVAPARRRVEQSGANSGIKRGAREMLRSLAARHPTPLSTVQVATLVQMAATGGTFRNYLYTLRTRGLIVTDGDVVTLTQEGLDAAGPVDQPRTTEELVMLWGSKLRAGTRKMLDVLVEAYPHGMTLGELAGRVGMTTSGGTFRNYIYVLKRNQLAVVNSREGWVSASPTLFGRDR